MVPSSLFLTKGTGVHQDELASFESALREAGIAEFNLVEVSSIFPPECDIVDPEVGISQLNPGEITHCVLSRASTNEQGRLLTSSIGIAVPEDSSKAGYLSEVHEYGKTSEQASRRAEGLAAEMLATVLGLEFDPSIDFEKKKEYCELSGQVVKIDSMTESARGAEDDNWLTVVSAAVFIE